MECHAATIDGPGTLDGNPASMQVILPRAFCWDGRYLFLGLIDPVVWYQFTRKLTGRDPGSKSYNSRPRV